MREIKLGFARYYNRRHNRRGYFWGDRFKSVIVDKGETLVNCLAYIDLNPLRAGLVERPEDYRWNSLGYHLQTQNKGRFLSTDFGLKEFSVKSQKERIQFYRRYMFEAGALNRPGKLTAASSFPCYPMPGKSRAHLRGIQRSSRCGKPGPTHHRS